MKFEEFNNEQIPRSYYDVLDVSRDASIDEIKLAYRQLAKKTHPDTSSNSDQNEEFLEITNAYKILADEEKRREYDAKEFNKQTTERTTDKNKKQEFYDNLSAEDKKIFHDLYKDETLGSMLDLLAVQNFNQYKKHVNDYISGARARNRKMEKDIEEYNKKLKDLEEMAEIEKRLKSKRGSGEQNVTKEFKYFTSPSYHERTHKKSNYFGENKENIRNLFGNIGIETTSFGERLVDTRTGKDIGGKRYKKITNLNGIIVGESIIGKNVINIDGSYSESFKDILLRDGMIIGVDVIDNEKLIDPKTGRSIGYKGFKKIIKKNGRIYGENILGRLEEIN